MRNHKGITDKEIIEAVQQYGGYRAAGRALGCSHASVMKRYRKLVPDASPKPHIKDGYTVKGISEYERTETGARWTKYDIDKVALEEAMIEKIESLTASVPVRPVVKNTGKDLNADLLNLYTFSDFHIGMLAWHREGGDNWNIDIATETLKIAYADMIARSPNAKACLINELGDWEHYTSMLSITPAHGHILDADSRPEKMISVAFDLMDYLVFEALNHHDEVIVSITPGNHNDFIALARKKAIMMLYRDNPRVKFLDSKTPYSAHVFGNTLLGFHHGHKRKPAQLPELFNNAYRDLLSGTEQTVIHTGHQHHKEVIEFGKTVVEMHRTLAARDGHASHGGWFSGRSTDAITYHKKHHEFSRVTIYPHLYGDC